MIVLGISALDKESTATIVRDGSIVAAVSEERLTRVKQQAGFPTGAAEAVLQLSGVSPGEIALVAYPFFDAWTELRLTARSAGSDVLRAWPKVRRRGLRHALRHYAAFTRRWRGYTIGQAVVLSMTLAVATQIVVLLSTLASYAAGLDTYWNHPLALLGHEADLSQKVPLGQALAARSFGFVANTFVSGPIAGALGWAMGGLLPER